MQDLQNDRVKDLGVAREHKLGDFNLLGLDERKLKTRCELPQHSGENPARVHGINGYSQGLGSSALPDLQNDSVKDEGVARQHKLGDFNLGQVAMVGPPWSTIDDRDFFSCLSPRSNLFFSSEYSSYLVRICYLSSYSKIL